EPARAQERIDPMRLPLHRALNRRVMQQRDAMQCAQLRERRLKLERLVDRFLDELLDRRLAPWLQRMLAEAAGEALHAREADAVHLAGVAVEYIDAGCRQNLLHLVLLARFQFVVAEHREYRDFHDGQFFGENLRLLGEPVVDEVAAEKQNIGALRDLLENRL